MRTIHISATQARKNFFAILQSVAQDKINFVVENRNLDKTITISLNPGQTKASQDEVDLDQLFGSLKPAKPYQDKEIEEARQIYIMRQAQKLSNLN
jgi:hypothetical protein